jgi:hypothetical protein
VTEPDFHTLDIAAVVAGRDYPETEVGVYLDESAAFAIYQLNEELTRLAAKQDETYSEVEAQFNDLTTALAEKRYTFHLRGIPRKVRMDALEIVEKKYPEAAKTDFLGRPIQNNSEADELHTSLIWQAHITKIVSPSGAEQIAPPLESIQEFRKYAPDYALATISDAIKEFSTGSKAGFEATVRSTDFLSEPSPEVLADI